MKVIEPGSLVREAAGVLAPIWRDVVVIGAAALQIHLAEPIETSSSSSSSVATITTDLDVAIVTPTRDVDLATEAESADAVVAELEAAGLAPSEEQYEAGFTWIREDLKIQLIRPFHPFPRGAAGKLPANVHLSLLSADEHRLTVAFRDTPDEPCLQVASTAALVALKQVAFGRKRSDGQPVERDFHDVHLLVSTRPDELETTYRAATLQVRSLVDKALEALASGSAATHAAARQHAQVTSDPDVNTHARDIARSAVFMQRRLRNGQS